MPDRLLPPAIAVSGLHKSFGEQTVLDGIDLEVPAGTVFSLLGPNGAGKTTAVNILDTLIRADAGEELADAAGRLTGAYSATSGVTIFLTTQYLDEADQLADRIALLDHGTVVAEGTPDELKRLVPGGHISVQFTDTAGLDAAARVLGDLHPDRDALALQIPSDGSVASLRALLDRFDDRSITVEKLSIHTPHLDDVFFALTGHPHVRAGADDERASAS